MGDRKKFKVKVTQLIISKPFLKVHVQNISNRRFSELGQLEKLFKQSNCDFVNAVNLDSIYIARVGQCKYERVRVVEVNDTDNTASVNFIDSGYQGKLSCNHLRLLDEASSLQSLKPLCKEFILAKIKIIDPGCVEFKKKLMVLHDMLIDQTCDMAILNESDAGRFVDLRKSDASLASDIIENHSVLRTILQVIPLERQLEIIRGKEKLEDSFKPETLVESPEGSEKSSKVSGASAVPSKISVRIAAFDKGPLSFFIHIASRDSEYQKFQLDLQKLKIDSNPLKVIPPVGSSWIARIDKQLFRVVIVESPEKLQRNQIMVQQQESGIKAIVEIGNLSKMPQPLERVPPYAKQFRLAGLKDGCVGSLSEEETDFYFQYATKVKLLTMKTVSNEGAVPSCQLFDEEINIIDKIKQCNPHHLQYVPQKPLRGDVHKVRVSSAISVQHFYVQLHETVDSSPFEGLVESLKLVDPPILRNPKIKDACIIKIKDINVRGRILSRMTSKIFKILAVDLGFEDDYELDEIKVIPNEFMKLPPQAIRCCLSEYDNLNDVDSPVEREFKDICLRLKDFQMNVVNRNDFCCVVELIDLSNGEEISDQLRDAGNPKLHNSDWTEQQTSIGTHFINQKFGDNSLWLIDVTPKKSKDSSNWDSTSNSVQAHDEDKSSTSDWTSEVRHEYEKQTESETDSNTRTTDSEEAAALTGAKTGCGSSESTSGVGSMIDTFKIKRDAIRITAITKPTDFVVQLKKSVEDYKAYCKELQSIAKAQAPLTDFSVGSFCLAYQTYENIWFRAIILDVDESESLFVSVKSCDDGTTFSIKNRSHLKESSINLIFKPYFGISCSLPIDLSSKKETDATSLLMKIMKSGDLTYQVLFEQGINRKVKFIELFDDGKNVTDEFVQRGFAKRLFMTSTQFSHAYINRMRSLTDFSIHMDRDSETLKIIVSYTDGYVRREIKDPKIGQIALGIFESDKCWYRVKILSKKNNGFEVYFIDHGHSGTVDSIGEIDDLSILSIHPIAIKCSLVVETIPKGSIEEIQALFKKFIRQSNKILVRMIKPGQTSALVEIKDEYSSVLNELMLDVPTKVTEESKDADNSVDSNGF